MRASLRVRGSNQLFAVTVKDISSTGLKANTAVSVFPGANVEIELPNIGWIAGQVIRAEEGTVSLRFAVVIDPDQTQSKVTGSYGQPPPLQPSPLFRV